jgi:hypothetical protein
LNEPAYEPRTSREAAGVGVEPTGDLSATSGFQVRMFAAVRRSTSATS